jgi:hypothetical protein
MVCLFAAGRAARFTGCRDERAALVAFFTTFLFALGMVCSVAFEDIQRRFLVRAAFLAARERAAFDGRPVGPGGTRFPSRRASESPMAIACSRLFTLPPFPAGPLFSVPRLNRRISRLTVLAAPREYFLAMIKSSYPKGPA